MEKRRGITVLKLTIIIVIILLFVTAIIVMYLTKNGVFNKKTETEPEKETVEISADKEKMETSSQKETIEKENEDGEKYIEGLIKIDQSDFETTKAQQTISGKILIGQDIEEMWYKVEAECGEKEYENIKYNNETWETEKFLLYSEGNKITVFAKANNQLYCSNTIKAYYDPGEAYELKSDNIKYDEKENKYYVNVVIINFKNEVSETRRNEIVKAISGRVVGRINGLNEFHVEVPHGSLSDLNKICAGLEKMDEVSGAYLDDLIMMN